jgi:hypothetical protein
MANKITVPPPELLDQLWLLDIEFDRFTHVMNVSGILTVRLRSLMDAPLGLHIRTTTESAEREEKLRTRWRITGARTWESARDDLLMQNARLYKMANDNVKRLDELTMRAPRVMAFELFDALKSTPVADSGIGTSDSVSHEVSHRGAAMPAHARHQVISRAASPPTYFAHFITATTTDVERR